MKKLLGKDMIQDAASYKRTRKLREQFFYAGIFPRTIQYH